ncbi:glycosyl hydrolase 108 family protein [Gilliamella sp. Pas-s27]|uniref:glycosyl hydrolase 108 family protein n=1 Tax=Gilliamella sp. Pas-s27 TaxID=2687311 RepID=UPI0019243F92|nr:glycosyl hydrolase 108 family protein [Gilliamella sp. Pas-s27]
MHVFIDKNDRQNRGFLAVGDEAKFEAYLSSVGKTKDSPEAKGFETLRREINRFPADYKESPSKKLTEAQFESYAKMEALEKQVTAWEKTKEKIKKMLWWDDVAKGLAKLNQQNDTPPKNGETTSTPTATTTATDTTPPATLSADGKAWFIHPVGISVMTKIKIDDCSLKFHRISKIVLKHEGGYVNNPNDSGGATNKGIAWNTWVSYAKQDLGIEPTLENLKKLTDEQAEIIYRKR